jgi:D-alanyl-D-alanine carboxypeptidase (penicillin-binding protein 5/6)
MRSIFPLLFSLLSAFSTVTSAQQAAFQAPPAPAIAAKAYVLLDLHSGQSLAVHEPLARVEPASLTKLMTAYLVFSALKQKKISADQVVPVSGRASRAEGSRMFIEPGKPVTVAELMKGMIVQSGNDACIALAEAIAGSEDAFVARMNREAQRLGLKNTAFANATGLSHPQHYSTAHDLALLAAAVIRDFPDHYPLYSQKEYRYNNITQANRNRLLWTDPTVDGMKTGYTENAGYCLVTSARRGDRRLVSVVLGAASESARAAESQKLLNHGFLAFESLRLYAGRHPVANLTVYKGATNRIKTGFIADLHVTLPVGSRDKLKATVESMQPLIAPISEGQAVGTLKISLDGQLYRTVPVVALESIPVAGILGRGWDALRLLFR